MGKMGKSFIYLLTNKKLKISKKRKLVLKKGFKYPKFINKWFWERKITRLEMDLNLSFFLFSFFFNLNITSCSTDIKF